MPPYPVPRKQSSTVDFEERQPNEEASAFSVTAAFSLDDPFFRRRAVVTPTFAFFS